MKSEPVELRINLLQPDPPAAYWYEHPLFLMPLCGLLSALLAATLGG